MNIITLTGFKALSVALVNLLFFSSCQKNLNQMGDTLRQSTTASTNVTTASTTTYQLVWSDEFDGTTVNTNNWTFETGGGGWGNNEKEYYQAANATVSNGNLVITAKKQRVN